MHLRNSLCAVCFALLPIVGVGCGPVSQVPDQLDVATSMAAKQPATAESGPAQFAGARWAFFRKAEDAETAGSQDSAAHSARALDSDTPRAVVLDDTPLGPYGALLNGGAAERPPVGAQIFLVTFGAAGQMTRVQENKYFFPDIYGVELEIGAGVNPAPFPGLTTESSSFGLTIGDRYGVAVFTEARLFGLHLANAVLYSWGTAINGRADGIFGYQIDFAGSPVEGIFPTGGDQYSAFATRE